MNKLIKAFFQAIACTILTVVIILVASAITVFGVGLPIYLGFKFGGAYAFACIGAYLVLALTFSIYMDGDRS